MRVLLDHFVTICFCASRKRMKALKSLLGLIQNYPRDDPQSLELQEDMMKLRAKFRQVLHLLKLFNSECPWTRAGIWYLYWTYTSCWSFVPLFTVTLICNLHVTKCQHPDWNQQIGEVFVCLAPLSSAHCCIHICKHNLSYCITETAGDFELYVVKVVCGNAVIY